MTNACYILDVKIKQGSKIKEFLYSGLLLK